MTEAAMQGMATISRVLRDGTVRISVDVPQEYATVAGQVLMTPDTPVALAVLNMKPVGEQPCADYGKEAQQLRRSSFFRSPDVWKAVGTDIDFLDWLKTQKCTCPGQLKVHCHGDVVPAHVRRVANGAGTGIKPPYSAIPMCDAHHRMQHSQGESRIAPKEWWNKQRIEWLMSWCWSELKLQLGYEHWNQVPTSDFYDWSLRNNVAHLLPECYRCD